LTGSAAGGYHPFSSRRTARRAVTPSEEADPVDELYRIKRLPPYVLATVTDLKVKACARGEDIIDLGMGNPDHATPRHLVEVPGAKDVGVEFFSLTKSYNIAGWRLGFACGNARMVQALARIKSYLDYGVSQPVQIAGIVASPRLPRRTAGGATCW
jgi:aspartate/methionine/tyrosine aminotransferase